MDKFCVFVCILMVDARIKTKDSVCLYTSQYLEPFSVEKSFALYMCKINTVNIFIFCILVFSQGSKLLVSLTFYVCFKIATTETFHFFAKSFIQVMGTELVIQKCDSKREKLLLSSQVIFFISPVLKLKQMGSVMWILIAIIIKKNSCQHTIILQN